MRPTISPLTVEQLPLCESFALAFHDEMQLPGVFSMESFLKFWTMFLTAPGYTATIFGLWRGDTLIGGLGALMAPDLNTGLMCTNEFFWFVAYDERQGSGALRLVRRFEEWGEEHGSMNHRLVHLLGPDGERFPKIYKKMGYRPIEVAYLKPSKLSLQKES